MPNDWQLSLKNLMYLQTNTAKRRLENLDAIRFFLRTNSFREHPTILLSFSDFAKSLTHWTNLNIKEMEKLKFIS